MKNDFFIENVRLIVRDLMRVTGWKENYILAKLVTSKTYEAIKLLDIELIPEKRKCFINSFCNENSISNDMIKSEVSEVSQALSLKILCFEKYCEIKRKTTDEVAELFALHSVGTYLETYFEVLRKCDETNLVTDLDIYITAREVAHQSEL